MSDRSRRRLRLIVNNRAVDEHCRHCRRGAYRERRYYSVQFDDTQERLRRAMETCARLLADRGLVLG